MEDGMDVKRVSTFLLLAVISTVIFQVCASDHIPNGTAPEAPSNLTGGALSDSRIILNWEDNSDNELGFDIYRAGTTWLKVGNVAEDVTYWIDSGLEDTTLYRYYIEAVGVSENSGHSNVLSIYTHAVGEPPEAPFNPLPYNGIDTTVTQIQLAWECSDPDSDQLSYDLYYGAETPPPLRVSDLTAPTYLIAHVQTDTVIYWQVVAKDGYHHETASPIWFFRNVNP
jgi:hypothetical protein